MLLPLVWAVCRIFELFQYKRSFRSTQPWRSFAACTRFSVSEVPVRDWPWANHLTTGGLLGHPHLYFDKKCLQSALRALQYEDGELYGAIADISIRGKAYDYHTNAQCVVNWLFMQHFSDCHLAHREVALAEHFVKNCFGMKTSSGLKSRTSYIGVNICSSGVAGVVFGMRYWTALAVFATVARYSQYRIAFWAYFLLWGGLWFSWFPLVFVPRRSNLVSNENAMKALYVIRKSTPEWMKHFWHFPMKAITKRSYPNPLFYALCWDVGVFPMNDEDFGRVSNILCSIRYEQPAVWQSIPEVWGATAGPRRFFGHVAAVATKIARIKERYDIH